MVCHQERDKMFEEQDLFRMHSEIIRVIVWNYFQQVALQSQWQNYLQVFANFL